MSKLVASNARTDEQWQRLNAALARAMGWTGMRSVTLDTLGGSRQILVGHPPADGNAERDGWGWVRELTAAEGLWMPPQFHISHDAKDTLLRWLASDNSRWKGFGVELILILRGNGLWVDLPHFEQYRRLMTAEPGQVVIAASKALQLEGNAQ